VDGILSPAAVHLDWRKQGFLGVETLGRAHIRLLLDNASGRRRRSVTLRGGRLRGEGRCG
jgi:hypothetical protein